MLKPETIEALQENGFSNLKDYLQDLSEQYAVPYSVVKESAIILGESELFDGLVSMVQDAEGMFEEEY
jgi:hypothetical protein